ncbi:MAG: hypothetical protein ABH879_03590 [archaeon]
MNRKIFALFVLSIMLMTGCVSQESFKTLQTQYDELNTEKSELEVLNENLTAEKSELQASNNDLAAEKSELEVLNENLTAEKSELDTQLTKNFVFLREYSIATNNIHVASSYFELGSTNLNTGNFYVLTEGYYYEVAISFYEAGKRPVLDAKELLTKAIVKLENIEEDAPNSFFKEDVKNRIEQARLLLASCDNLYSLLDYEGQHLYEVNFGTAAKATEYFNRYNSVVTDYNSNLKTLSDIQNKIDLNWDQDWYPTFQEESVI